MNKTLAAISFIAVVVLCGVAGLIGWVFHVPLLVRVHSTWVEMTLGTAQCLMIAGLVLALPDRVRVRYFVSTTCGLVLLAIGSVALADQLHDWDIRIDWGVLFPSLSPDQPHLNRIAPTTSTIFILVGLSLTFFHRSTPFWRHFRQAIASSLVLLGSAGLVGYLLRFDYIYSWGLGGGIAFHTAIGVAALGVALHIATQQEAAVTVPPEEDGRSILVVVSTTVTVISVIIALSAVAFMLNETERIATEQLRRQYQDQSQYCINAILQGITRAGAIATHADVLTAMRRLKSAAGDTDSERSLAALAEDYMVQGFTYVAFSDGGLIHGHAGSSPQKNGMDIALYQRDGRHLIWRDGFYLRLKLPLHDNTGVLGEVVTEEPLEALTSLLAASEEWGKTSEMQLCMLGSEPFRCFPSRSYRSPFVAPHHIESDRLPMTYALKGSGSVLTRDIRGHRVIAAYGPVGNSGLGMILQIDAAELYAPIRQQLLYLLIVLVMAIVITRLLVKRRLRPLVQQLVQSRQSAQMNEARFLAAAENNLDAFYIFTSVRAEDDQLIDFRFAFVNKHGAELISNMMPVSFPGLLMSMHFPLVCSSERFSIYTQVAESGASFVHEVMTRDSQINAAWVSEQIVKLGDGIAVTLRDISQQKSAEEKLRHMAQNDALTGLPNRALFLDRLHLSIARVRRNRRAIAVLFMDVDHFKSINDNHGHAAGDELLRVYAERLRASSRDTDTVARMGGDEFTAILEDLDGRADAEVVVIRFLASLKVPITLAADEVTITSSIGVVMYSAEDDHLSPDALLQRADEALYRAKRAGRNRYVVYEQNVGS